MSRATGPGRSRGARADSTRTALAALAGIVGLGLVAAGIVLAGALTIAMGVAVLLTVGVLVRFALDDGLGPGDAQVPFGPYGGGG